MYNKNEKYNGLIEENNERSILVIAIFLKQ